MPEYLQRQKVQTDAHNAGLGQIGDARPQPSHRCDGAISERFEIGDSLLVDHVVRASPVVVIRLHPRRAIHPKGIQQVVGDEVLHALIADPTNDPAQHGEPEVGVLAVRVRRPREGQAVADESTAGG